MCVQNLGVPDDPRVWSEARSLAASGYDVTVVAPSTAGAPATERIDGVEILRTWRAPAAGGVAGQLLEVVAGFVGTARSVLRLRRAGPLDVLHVANPPDTLFPLAWVLRRSGTTFVYDQHDTAPELLAAKLGRRPLLAWLARFLERRSYRAAHLVLVPNNTTRGVAIGRGGCSPSRVVTVRIGQDRAAPQAWRPPEIPTVVYAGVIGTQDTVEVLIDAFALLRRTSRLPARLVLVGDGDAAAAMRRRVVEHGIADDVTFTGWVRREEVARYLAAATLGVSPDVDHPYTQTCTMIKVGEYLSAGLPAVVADLPENRATAGDAAVYFRPGDVADLAARLGEVLFDPARCAALGAAAAQRAPLLRWAHSEERLVGAYRHILGGGPPVEGDQHVDDTLVERGT